MKYLHYILIIILLTISSSTKAQELLFHKTIEQSIIKLIDSSNVYRILYKNDSINKEFILLEEYRYNPESRKDQWGNQREHWFGIINTTVKDDILYILYYNYGLVQLKTYCFLKENIKVKSHFIDKKNLSSSVNAGPVRFFSEMKWINDNIFMEITTGQIYGGSGTSGLYVYDSAIDSIKKVFFKDGKFIKDHNKLFAKLDLDENKDTVSKHIKEALLENKELKENNNFKYLGYLDDPSSYSCAKTSNVRISGWICFFYQDTSSLLDSIKIIQYQNHEESWYISGYRKVSIEEANTYNYNTFNPK